MPFSLLENAIGRPLDAEARRRITEYGTWLESEGLAAGGIGPSEVSRLWERHIADAACFSTAWRRPPPRCLDVGTGVGLPGIVLAILWPGTEMHLIERSGRRCRLLRRVVRVLELENVQVYEADVNDWAEQSPAMVMRAVFPPAEAVRQFGRLLEPSGIGVLGLSRVQPPDMGLLRDLSVQIGLNSEILTAEVLDPPGWMLMMTQS